MTTLSICNPIRYLRHGLLLATVIAGAGFACSTQAEKQEVILYDVGWDSATIQTRVAAYVIEHGYGYPVSVITGQPVPFYPALENDTAHINFEIWLPNQQEPYDSVIERGIAVDLGKSIEDSWQGFGVPQYFKDANPGLVSVFDIPDYAPLLATADTQPKGRIVNCVPGWACEEINVRKVAGYGLNESLTFVNPGSEAALLADLGSSYSRGEPWLGYVWGPSMLSFDYEMYVLEEPEFSEECWTTDKACEYPVSEVKILAAKSLVDRAPEIADFLRAWDLEFDQLSQVVEWMYANSQTPTEGAEYYLRTFPEIWQPFVTADTARRIERQLNSN